MRSSTGNLRRLPTSADAGVPANVRANSNAVPDIRVYQRKSGRETWGCDRDDGFDGERLRVAELNATFDLDERQWSATWSLDDETPDVVLERPRPADRSKSSPLCGEWEGQPRASTFPAPTRLHVVQSSDGTLTAWMDRMLVVTDQRHGELLAILSADPLNVTFELVSSTGIHYRFSGNVSNDGLTLSGHWNGLSASGNCRRVH